MENRPNNKDKRLIYNLYNTATDYSSKFIDYFFNELYDPKEFYIHKVDGVIMCALRVCNTELLISGYFIEVNIVKDFIYADNCPQILYEKFIHKVMSTFKYKKLMTLVSPHLKFENYGFENTFKQKRYKLYRRDLFNVDGYNVDDQIKAEDLHMTYNEYIKHYKGYIVKREAYFEEQILLNQAKNYEMYVSKSANQKVMGYIVYNYHEGELEVLELVYLDATALITLLHQAMGLNNYIYINSSIHEDLSLVFPNIKFSITDSMLMRVNDGELFERLFRVDVRTFNSLILGNKKLLYIGPY